MLLPEDVVLRYLTPIVRGQIRSYLNDHPEVLAGPQERMARKVELGMSKRILGEFRPGSHTRGVTGLLLAISGGGPTADRGCEGSVGGDGAGSAGIGPAGGAIGRVRPAAGGGA